MEGTNSSEICVLCLCMCFLYFGFVLGLCRDWFCGLI